MPLKWGETRVTTTTTTTTTTTRPAQQYQKSNSFTFRSRQQPDSDEVNNDVIKWQSQSLSSFAYSPDEQGYVTDDCEIPSTPATTDLEDSSNEDDIYIEEDDGHDQQDDGCNMKATFNDDDEADMEDSLLHYWKELTANQYELETAMMAAAAGAEEEEEEDKGIINFVYNDDEYDDDLLEEEKKKKFLSGNITTENGSVISQLSQHWAATTQEIGMSCRSVLSTATGVSIATGVSLATIRTGHQHISTSNDDNHNSYQNCDYDDLDELDNSCHNDVPDSHDMMIVGGGDDSGDVVPGGTSSRICINQARDAAIGAIFDRLDLDQDGLLDRRDLEAMLLDAATTIKLKVEPAVIDAAIDALIEDAESDEAIQSMEDSYLVGDYNASRRNSCSLACCDALDSINKAQFSDIFKRHPEMLRVFLFHPNKKGDSKTKNDTCASSPPPYRPPLQRMSESQLVLEQEEYEQIWGTRWKNWNVTVFWLVLYLLANVAAFTIKVLKYCHNEEAQAVFGGCIMIARGAAQCLNLNCSLILLPMAKHLITRLRRTKARHYFPFDAILDVHKLIGGAILFWTVVHVGAHMADFYMFSRADEEDILALVGDKLGDRIPADSWGRWKLLLKSKAGVTGVVMVVCMLIAYPLIRIRRRYFNTFWFSHHLLVVMLIALCFHGTDELLEKAQSTWWLLFPLVLYLVPRFLRESYCSQATVVDAKIKKGEVLCLRLQKPAHWDPILQSGMYAFIKVPAVSRFQWHPFTLTSSKSDPYLEFHISKAGDWTSALHRHVQSLETRSKEDLRKSVYGLHNWDNDFSLAGDTSMTTASASDVDNSMYSIDRTINDSIHSSVTGGGRRGRFHVPGAPPQAIRKMVVKIEGPIGASSQGFKDYPIVVLVGAGIGVTPMISVLKELLINPGRMQRVFFYWTLRDRAAFEWFSDIMDKVYRQDRSHVLQVRHFLTSVKDDNRDIGAVLLHHATRAKHRADGFDLILGQQTHHQVEVGRPNWSDELTSIKREAKDLGHNRCGIFLCGPARMAEALSDVSMKFSRSDPKFHFHFNKETF